MSVNLPGMRIRRHHIETEDEVRPEPAWVAGKPVWSVVHIEAPRAGELARSADEHDAHRPPAAA
jgi:hypothetical protein